MAWHPRRFCSTWIYIVGYIWGFPLCSIAAEGNTQAMSMALLSNCLHLAAVSFRILPFSQSSASQFSSHSLNAQWRQSDVGTATAPSPAEQVSILWTDGRRSKRLLEKGVVISSRGLFCVEKRWGPSLQTLNTFFFSCLGLTILYDGQ
jgi:hypothetical protein